MVGQASHISSTTALFTFFPVSQGQSLFIRHTFRHESVLHQQVVNEKWALIVLGFLVNPEFVQGDVGVPVVLTEVSKLFIDMTADVAAINDPHLQITPLLHLLNVRQF
jgi:hypothetical protein